MECFINVLNYGLRFGGGIGELMLNIHFGKSEFAEKVLFEVGFFIIINVILLNIVFDNIIDTFAELREKLTT